MEETQIQNIAQLACFSTNYEIKTKAQQKFYSLCIHITSSQLQQLMVRFSQNVLFVTMEYIEKIIPQMKSLHLIFQVINNCCEKWYSTNANSSFIREDGAILQYHVQNSVSRTIGKCLKYIYMQKEQQDQIIKFIKNRQNHRYQLFLWKIFIQTVSVVDSELSFLNYRSLVYNFQQHIIPLIMDDLLPYFQSVKEQIQISDLTKMHEKMSIEDLNNKPRVAEDINLFNPNEIRFTKLVFAVLKEVICFNYNITYSQFQSEEPIDNCLVCFPDPVTKKVAHKQFLSSIFFVAEKLINDNFQNSNLNKEFLTTTLQCIQKIMLTKLFYISSQMKSEFIKTVLACMSRLLSSNNLNENIILSLIQSNIKFLINVELHLLLKSYQAEYQSWIFKVRFIVENIFSKSIINVENALVLQSVELVAKIVEDSMSSSSHMKTETLIFKKFGSQLVKILLTRLFTQEESLLEATKIRSYQDLKKNISQFIKRIRHLSCLNLFQTLRQIQPIINTILNSSSVNSISNVFFFFSEFCDAIVLQKNILYEPQQSVAGFQLGKILSSCLAWISKYRQFKSSIQIIQVSILLFIEKLLGQVLSYFSYEDGRIKITAEIYKHIVQSSTGINSEQFLIFCYNEIATNIKYCDFNRASYTFESLTTLLLKFKWGMKRQYFQQTNVAKFILEICKDFSENSFDGDLITLRKQLYRIITNISFDDTLDDYRTNITNLVISLEKSLIQNRWRVLYDLTGICQAIDTSAIYRYFLVTLDKSKTPIELIMTQFFNHIEQASNNNPAKKIQIIKCILKLQSTMIDNKGQRLGGCKNSYYNYKLIASLMPYWVIILNMKQSSQDEWDEIILQIYKIFNTLLKNGNTNFFMLQRIIASYPQYLKLLLQNMVNIAKWVQLYPNLFTQYRLCIQNLSVQLMEVIFCNKDQQIPYFFNQLLNNLMNITAKSILSLSQGNKSMEDNIEMYLQIIKSAFRYLKEANKLSHKEDQVNNIKFARNGIQIKYNYLLQLFKFGITFGKKMPRALELACKNIQHMDFLSESAIPVICQKLGLNEQSGKELFRIWREQESDNQFCFEMEGDQFVANIKQWFKSCNNSTMSQPDY